MILDNIKELIKKHAIKVLPQECCGFVVKNNENINIIECMNIAINPNINFQISSSEFLKVKNRYQILYVYHSHPVKQDLFSPSDIITANNLNIPIILYSVINNIFKIYDPRKISKYLGLTFKYKKNDCLTLIKNYYLNELNQNVNIDKIYEIFEARGHLSDLYDITKNNFVDLQNFKLINTKDIKENDILLLKNDKGYPCHYGIYMDNYHILHQTVDHSSVINNYYNKQEEILIGLRRSNL
jgi:proteasome lid subunit RPN8/RPN11